jgi:holo-[acyl-carrier protein] synthase
MIEGTGIDIIDLERLQKVITRQRRFPERILTDGELRIYETLNERRRIEFLSGRFAAKEAYAKAKGCGIGRQLSWKDIEISNGEGGRPTIKEKSAERLHLSISHTKEYAIAQVIIESSSSSAN